MLFLKIESFQAFIAPNISETWLNDFGVAANCAERSGSWSSWLCEDFCLSLQDLRIWLGWGLK